MTQRADLEIIAGLISAGEAVLDVGCGDGALLEMLARERGVRARGLELSQDGVARSVAKGLAVVQGDASRDLEVYPDDAFDVAILSKTIQEMADPEKVLHELRRIARRLIVSFRNYGYWRYRRDLLIRGQMPRPGGRAWHQSGSVHACTARDLCELAALTGLSLSQGFSADAGSTSKAARLGRLNWAASEVVLVFDRQTP